MRLDVLSQTKSFIDNSLIGQMFVSEHMTEHMCCDGSAVGGLGNASELLSKRDVALCYAVNWEDRQELFKHGDPFIQH